MRKTINSFLERVCHSILSKLDDSYFPYRSVNYDKLVDSIEKQSMSGRVYLYNSIVEKMRDDEVIIIETAVKKRKK